MYSQHGSVFGQEEKDLFVGENTEHVDAIFCAADRHSDGISGAVQFVDTKFTEVDCGGLLRRLVYTVQADGARI